MTLAMRTGAASTIDAEDITRCFNRCFSADAVVLIGGASEPFYEPAAPGKTATIRFRDDYLRSALHEVAHWCHAGVNRRQLPDYGYWYSPDDRDAQEQAAFFAVEARPQALESLFCDALGLAFAPSVDNLSLDIAAEAIATFAERIASAKACYRRRGLPNRARRFVNALAALSP